MMTLRYLSKFTDPENITSTYPVMEPDVYEALQMASSVDHKLYFHKPVHIPVPGVKDQYITMQGEVINELKSQMVGNGELMRNYISQVQHQMVCTGGDFALVSVLESKMVSSRSIRLNETMSGLPIISKRLLSLEKGRGERSLSGAYRQ